MTGFDPIARLQNGAVAPIALPPAPRLDPLVTAEGQCAFRISGFGQFSLEELMLQEYRSGTAKVEAVYFKTESGNVYKAVGTRDGILLSDQRGGMNSAEFKFDKCEEENRCSTAVQIGKPFIFGDRETNPITAIEFVSTERVSADRLEFIREWGAAKNTVLVEEFSRREPTPDLLPRPASDLHGVPTVYEFELQRALADYITGRGRGPAPALYVETESGGRLVVFAEQNRVLITDINKCAQSGEFTAADFSSFWHPDIVGPSRTLAVGDQFRYAIPAGIGREYFETSRVTRLVPLEDFAKSAEGILPQDSLITCGDPVQSVAGGLRRYDCHDGELRRYNRAHQAVNTRIFLAPPHSYAADLSFP